MMKDEMGREVDAVEHIIEQLEGLLDRWKAALKNTIQIESLLLPK